MPVDATGSVSAKLGIYKYNTGADAPSGKGLNNIVDDLDDIISRLGISGPVANDVPVYDSVAGKWKKASGTPSSSTFLRGDGSWATPPPGSVVQISDTILGASAATIDLTSIPATYRHLKIVTSLRCDQVGTSFACLLRINNDSGANYADTLWQAGTGTVNETNSGTSWTEGANGTTAAAGFFWDTELLIPNYARTDRAKTHTALHSIAFALTTGNHLTRMSAGVWNSTAAINRLTWSLAAGNFIAGSTVTLYGIT